MNIKIFADGSNIKEIFDLYENNKLVKGFTTNPSLMKKAGVINYESFIKEVTSKIKDLSISFEVFADDEKEMINQAKKLLVLEKTSMLKFQSQIQKDNIH